LTNSEKNKKKYRGLVIGCGSIGERHIHNLQKIGIKDIQAYDMDKKKSKVISEKYKIKSYDDFDSALESKPDFSIICTYPDSHIRIASECVKINSHVFIEKPISGNIEGITRFLKFAKSRKKKVGIGYNLRFDKGLILLKENLQKNYLGTPLFASVQWGQNIRFWHNNKNFRDHYILKKGNGIILDDSHEYDYLRWMFNDEIISIFCNTSKSKLIKTETESIAQISVKFKKGLIANLILDYLRPNYERNCHIICEKGDYKWEFLPQKIQKNYNTNANSKLKINYVQNKHTKILNKLVKMNDMYLGILGNFINSIHNNVEPEVNGWEGLKTLKIGLAALESSRKNKKINIKY